MYKRILLAYNGTAEGALALREGALLAMTCDAKVVLLSVVPNSAGGAELVGGVGGALAQEMGDYGDLLNRAVAWLKERGIDSVPRLAVGEPAPIIGMVARQMGADLVVVGHQRQNFLSRWWSGSTQAYLSDQLDCSVLIARSAISEESFDRKVRTWRSASPRPSE